jgi:sigma-B regulation protein RsbU (phosphoserine phosphatase)
MGLAMFLARRVSGPILALTSFLGTVGSGDLTHRAHLGGAREFRQLSAALNRMIRDLRDRMRLRTALSVAMEVQQKLLPLEAPQVEGLDLAGFSAYCDETGGDYYDYLLLDKEGAKGVVVAVGDVIGHGIGAALLMAEARAILHSRVTSCDRLGDLLTHLNDLLVSDMMAGRFMTVFLWGIDARRQTACWASAGHDPAIIYDPKADRFEETGLGDVPLGIEAEVAYEEHQYGPIRPGQVIVLGTDGVWETVNGQGEMFGKARLQESIRSAHQGSALEIAAAISRDLNGFRGGIRQRDDVTLVVIKVLERQ